MSNENQIENIYKISKTESAAGRILERIQEEIKTPEKMGLIASAMELIRQRQQQQM